MLGSIEEVRNNRVKLMKYASEVIQQNEPIFVILPILGFLFGLGIQIFIRKKEKREKKHNFDINCSVCFERGRELVFYPCKHISVCAECGEQLVNCPMCRTRIDRKYFIENYINLED